MFSLFYWQRAKLNDYIFIDNSLFYGKTNLQKKIIKIWVREIKHRCQTEEFMHLNDINLPRFLHFVNVE